MIIVCRYKGVIIDFPLKEREGESDETLGKRLRKAKKKAFKQHMKATKNPAPASPRGEIAKKPKKAKKDKKSKKDKKNKKSKEAENGDSPPVKRLAPLPNSPQFHANLEPVAGPSTSSQMMADDPPFLGKKAKKDKKSKKAKTNKKARIDDSQASLSNSRQFDASLEPVAGPSSSSQMMANRPSFLDHQPTSVTRSANEVRQMLLATAAANDSDPDFDVEAAAAAAEEENDSETDDGNNNKPESQPLKTRLRPRKATPHLGVPTKDLPPPKSTIVKKHHKKNVPCPLCSYKASRADTINAI